MPETRDCQSDSESISGGDRDRDGRAVGGQSSSILEALRSDDETARQTALQRLYDMLTPHAQRKLGGRRDGANMLPESIVQSVIVREVACGGLTEINDDQHLEARLRRAINNKIIDRRRKRRAAEMPVNSEGAAYDPAGDGPGPGTQLVDQEEIMRQANQLSAFKEACAGAPISDTQRRILELVIFEDQTIEEAAELCSTTPPTIKVRLSEARKKIVPHLLQPVRAEVDGTTWAIIDMMLIQRRSTDRCRAMLGVDDRQIRQAIQRSVYPVLLESYGAEGIALFQRLLGNRKG
jgi:RNA polymerase sigma factor (sigma-70 family)